MLIRSPAPAEVPAVAALLAEAFVDDPVMANFLPQRIAAGAGGAADRRRRFERLFLAEIRSGSLDEVDAAFDVDASPDRSGTTEDQPALLGAAVWRAPGAHTSFRRSLVELPGMLRAFGVRGLRTFARYGAQTESYAPSTPHWHLLDIGASPAARGRGVGGALLAHRLDILDSLGEAGFLEATTEGSRRLYERHGFEPLALLDEGPAAGATMMLRRPRTGPAGC